MQPENDLRDKRVIVIGGSSGIGLAVAQNAVSRGAKIVIASSNERRLQKAVEGIGGEARARGWTSPMKGPSKPSLRSLVQSIT